MISLNEIQPKEIVPGYRARFIHTNNMTFAYWDVKAGYTLPEHSHVHEQVANVLEGVFKLVVDGVEHIIEPGKVVVIPSHAKHYGTSITDCKLLDVFYPIREDYKNLPWTLI